MIAIVHRYTRNPQKYWRESTTQYNTGNALNSGIRGISQRYSSHYLKINRL